MRDFNLRNEILDEARRDPLGFLWGICQCVILLAVCYGILVLVLACGPGGAR